MAFRIVGVLILILLGVALTARGSSVAANPAGYEEQKAAAEDHFAKGSYGKAHAAYAAIPLESLTAAEKRWVTFRLADTEWRAAGVQNDQDIAHRNHAQTELQKIISNAPRAEDHDRVWAEAAESFGDFYWVNSTYRYWYQAWQSYAQALDWWAGADVPLEQARDRYLSICWRVERPPGVDSNYYYGSYGNQLPLEVLENVLSIAVTEADKARAHYLTAMALRSQGGDYERLARISQEFEAALQFGKKTDWYDDALFNYAQYLQQSANGSWTSTPDYVGALALYQRLVKEFKKGETRWWDSAQQQAEEIVRPQLSVGVSNIFLPGSLLQYAVSWRNVPKIEFTLYKVDLSSSISFNSSESSGSWLQNIDRRKGSKVKSWIKDTQDKKEYRPGNAQETIEALPLGAYLLEGIATGNNGTELSARDLVLVTQTSIVVKSASSKVVLYVCDAATGAPRPHAKTTLKVHHYDGNGWLWKTRSEPADENGLVEYNLHNIDGTIDDGDLFATAASDDEQAYSTGSAPSPAGYSDSWKIYAFTDRPAYRPGDKAQWKIIARVHDHDRYNTPANTTLKWEITDPQGAKVAEGKSTLNAFGSASGEVQLTDKMPLGEYRIQFHESRSNNGIGNAVLLRLEEYKLPEFTVSVKTPEDDSGRRKSYRLGDKVTAEVQVDYYFGGAVANADVQLLVYQNYYYAWWQPSRDYPWFYEDMLQGRPNYYGGGGVIKQVNLKTDAKGKGQITFDTPRSAGNDFEYRIEARVTDSSRREVTGSGSVRVTRQKSYTYLTPAHSIFAPHEKVTVDVKTLDANEEPFPAEGTVVISRQRWLEVWNDPFGKELSEGERSKHWQDDASFMAKGYQLKFRGYKAETVETRTVKTDAKGEAEITFTPDLEGYYQYDWTTPEAGRNPVKAATNVWIANINSAELGYRHGGLQILLDKDTVQPGATVPVMISVPANDRWVLFSVGGDDLNHYELLHLTGTIKLVQIKMDDSFVPNVFLHAQMVRDQQIFEDTKQVVVPPIKHYLTVSVEPDKKEYQARDEGSWKVVTRDDTGKPVAAEVAMGVVDESIYAIQSELAGDPRKFYFGEKRGYRVQTQTSFNQKAYRKIVVEPPPEPGVISPVHPDVNLPEGEDDSNEMRKDSARGMSMMDSASMAPASPMALAAPPPAPSMQAAAKTMAGPSAHREAAHGGPPRDAGGAGGAPPEPNVVVRTDFRATAFWGPQLVTGADGTAQVTLKYPDSLTTWRATARAQSQSSQFGITTGSVKTRMPLLVRLQGPRFFVVGDKTLVSGVVNNNTDKEISAKVELQATGLTVEDNGPRTVKVSPGGEARVDWKVRVETAGETKLNVKAVGGSFGDAMEKSFPIYEHGIDKLVARSGKLRGDSVLVKLAIPKERREGSTELSVQVAPSMAITMLDALPYLIDYPYGCTEQTMSRFLPAAIVSKTLSDLGLDAKKAMARSFGGIEPEFVGKTHPKAPHDLKELGAMTSDGLNRLYDFQRSDGGWGWWKEGEHSDRYMSAYVLWGLSLARDGGIKVREDVLSRAADYLAKELVSEKTNPDRQAWLLHALSAYYTNSKRKAPGEFEKKAFDNLWAGHKDMNAYTRALFALSAWRYGYREQAQTLATNLENGVIKDNKPDVSMVMEGNQSSDASVMGTAHWGQETYWTRWSDSGIEATSFVIMALATIDPKSALVEPAVNWLIKNRRGGQWSNTKDTAISVLALTQYLKTSGELGGPMEYSLSVNGKEIARKKLTVDEALAAPSRFYVDSSVVTEANQIKLTRISGTGPLYFSAEARFFSLEEPITPAGHEIFVRRSYYKKASRKTLLKGFVYDRVPLLDGGTVQSGDRIEVVVTVESKNNYEYLLFEDLKPAGFEAVEVKSGQPLSARQVTQASFERNYGKIEEDGSRKKGLGASTDAIDYTGDQRSIYVELRDRKVALFADALKQGVWEMRYELRAEVPGKFHALPLMGQAMYVPEIRANSAEVRVEVVDKPQ